MLSRALPRLALAALTALFAGALASQPPPPPKAPMGPSGIPVERAETLVLHAHQLAHQPAREALPLVEPMLSPRGSLELRAQTNTLIVRDHASIVEAVRATLREFDHPPVDLVLDVFLLSSTRREDDLPLGADVSGLPPALIEGLGSMIRFNSYQVLAEGQLVTREGQQVSYDLGSRYALRFQVGTVLGARVLKLRGFELVRRNGSLDQPLLSTDLNVTLRRMQVLALAASENAERGLVVALTCRPRSALDVRLGGS
jgi:hypothetical protein